MPELPEVETIKQGLKKIVGQKITKVFRSDKKLRITESLDLQGLVGKTILKILRRARYLIIHLSYEKSLIIHLGMSGKFTNRTSFEQLKHDHFACKLSDGSWLIFNDPRRFGFVEFLETKNLNRSKIFANLGPEPLSKEFNSDYLAEKLHHKKMNIKTSLMDNKIVVGVGNIYVNESLFDAGISPLRNCCTLSGLEITRLTQSIKKIIKKAIELKGSSISDYVDFEGKKGGFQNSFKIYGRDRELCDCCQSVIKKIQQNGRASFYCLRCQK